VLQWARVVFCAYGRGTLVNGIVFAASILTTALNLGAPGHKPATRPSIDPPPGTKTELLWPDGAPGALADKDADKPALTWFVPPAEKRTHTAIIVCPGGGYGGLAIDHEGWPVAEWFNSVGITAIVLKYRVAPYRHPAPLMDAQRAMRTVRARAGEFGIDPRRIGMIGFSAGGHLVSTAATHFDSGKADAADALERLSSRPDFVVLMYPVITFDKAHRHEGSMRNLLGPDPTPEMMEKLSNEKQVTRETPPTFLVHTGADKGVPVENSVMFYEALRKAGVPAELHVFQRGDHGFALGGTRGKPKDPVLAVWPGLCANWLRVNGFLP
jgi:acetyl esterase/lipase